MIAIELIFSLGDVVGSLRGSLGFFKEQSISLKHIQSRPSLYSKGSFFEFLVEFEVDDDFDLIAFESKCMKALGNDVKIMMKKSPISGKGKSINK